MFGDPFADNNCLPKWPAEVKSLSSSRIVGAGSVDRYCDRKLVRKPTLFSSRLFYFFYIGKYLSLQLL